MIWNLFQRPAPVETRPEGDLALAMLLVRAARIDGDYDRMRSR